MTMIHRNVWLGMGLGLGMALAGCYTSVPGGSELERDDENGTTDEARFHRVDEPIEGRYIVVLQPDMTQRGVLNPVGLRANALASNYKAAIAMELEGVLDGFVAEMAEPDAIELSKDPAVAFVEQDGVVHALAVQNNPPVGLDRIDQLNLPLDRRYNFEGDGTAVHAYVIDTGIRATHQGLGGRIGEGFTAVNDGNGTDDCVGHGTHVAGTIGSDLFGVAKNVTLHAVRVLDCSGSGSNSGVIAGVNFVARNAEKPAVANMSLGGGVSAALDQAVRAAIATGVTFALAAGNENQDACNSSPGRTAEALTVASIGNANDRRSSFSNFGTCVDIFAPGEQIESLFNASDTATAVFSGTSMATPHVAGVAALFLQNNPDATPAEVGAALTAGATAGLVLNATGSPNRLLNTAFLTGGAPPPPPPPPPGGGTPQSGSAEGDVLQGQRINFAPLPVLAGTSIEVQLSDGPGIPGDADLYVSIDQPPPLVARPTFTETLCAPFVDGSNESCSLTVPDGATQFFIVVHGFSAASFHLEAQWVEP